MVVGTIVPGRAMVLVAPGDANHVLAGGPASEGVWSFIIESVANTKAVGWGAT